MLSRENLSLPCHYNTFTVTGSCQLFYKQLWHILLHSDFFRQCKKAKIFPCFFSEWAEFLNLFRPTISFYTHWKHQKTSAFLMFSGGKEGEN